MKNVNETFDRWFDNVKENLKSVSEHKMSQQRIRLIKISIAVSFVIIFGVLITVTLDYMHEIDRPNVIQLDTLSKPYHLTSTETFIDGTKISNTFKKRMLIEVSFTTDQLSANKPIPVLADYIFDENIPESAWEDLPDVMILAFPHSYNYDDSSSAEAVGGILKMKKMQYTHIYRGIDELVFPIEGNYGYVILNPEIAPDFYIENSGNGISTIHITGVNLDDYIEPKSEFYVSAASSSNQFQQLTEIGIYLSLILIGSAFFKTWKLLVKGIDRFLVH